MAVEEPVFQIVVQEGPFAIRDYPARVVAEVDTTGGRNAAARDGFRILAAYIFGGNAATRGIAMTAPVTQEPASATSSLAVAPGRLLEDVAWTVRFTMPSRHSLETLPAPDDHRVRLRPTPPGRFAVVRFSGLAPPAKVATKAAQLAAWMQRRGLKEAGVPSLARYDPPWTPGFIRRNEVMIPTEPPTSPRLATT